MVTEPSWNLLEQRVNFLREFVRGTDSKNIFQINTGKKDWHTFCTKVLAHFGPRLDWPHFDDKPRAQVL